MNLILAVTGCSGVIYGKRLLEACIENDIKTKLILSEAAEEIIQHELDQTPRELREKSSESYEMDEIGAEIASGSVNTDGMVIAPCSMKTVGSLASGVADNLITRAADVTLKEGRKLVLVPRETPLNQIHLDNLSKLKSAGATILPAMPGFYHDPQSVEDLADFVVGKILDQFGVDHQLYEPWKGLDE